MTDPARSGQGGTVPPPIRAVPPPLTTTHIMSVAKVIEIKAGSKKSFEAAVKKGVAHASKSIKNIRGCWVAEQEAVVEDGEVVEFRVLLKLTFVLEA